MTSPAQIRANRQNARRSTGPRTPLGRSTSSQNARRHGLTAAPPGEVVLSHLRAILDDPSATPEAALETQIGTAALALATAEARLDRAREHAATVTIRQPSQELREEIEMVAGALLENAHRFDFDTQASPSVPKAYQAPDARIGPVGRERAQIRPPLPVGGGSRTPQGTPQVHSVDD